MEHTLSDDEERRQMLSCLPKGLKRRLKGLRVLQHRHDLAALQLSREIAALEAKFHEEIFKELYTKREAIVNGTYEPQDSDLVLPENIRPLACEELIDISHPATDVKSPDIPGIPGFWLNVLLNHPTCASLITQRDQKALRSLTDIKLEFSTEEFGTETPVKMSCFELQFFFAPNDYFSNEKLSKKYFLFDSDDTCGDGFDVHKTECTPIDWKNGMSLVVQRQVKVQRHRKASDLRQVESVVPVDSFFSFFQSIDSDAAIPFGADKDELYDALELDFEIAEIIRDNIIPEALVWYLDEVEYSDEESDESEYDEE